MGADESDEEEENQEPEDENKSEDEKKMRFEDPEQLQSGSREPKKLRDPLLPSPEEVRAHEMTHLPYRSWCVHCVRGKGKSMAHANREKEDDCREVHMDYCFMGGRDD